MEEPLQYHCQPSLPFPQTICADCFKAANLKTGRRMLVIYCEHHQAAAVMVRDQGSLAGRWVIFTQMSAGELTERLSNGIIDHWCTMKSLALALLLGSLLAAGLVWAEQLGKLQADPASILQLEGPVQASESNHLRGIYADSTRTLEALRDDGRRRSHAGGCLASQHFSSAWQA